MSHIKGDPTFGGMEAKNDKIVATSRYDEAQNGYRKAERGAPALEISHAKRTGGSAGCARTELS